MKNLNEAGSRAYFGRSRRLLVDAPCQATLVTGFTLYLKRSYDFDKNSNIHSLILLSPCTFTLRPSGRETFLVGYGREFSASKPAIQI